MPLQHGDIGALHQDVLAHAAEEPLVRTAQSDAERAARHVCHLDMYNVEELSIFSYHL